MKILKYILISSFIFMSVNPALAAGANNTGLNLNGSTTWQEAPNIKNCLQGYEVNNCFPETKWWCQFNDPILNNYIDEALRANQDIKYASARVEESRALARYTMANEFPQVALYGLFTRIRNSQNFLPSIIGLPPILTSTQRTEPINLYIVPVVAQYELDYLLKNRSLTRSAYKEAEATQLDYQTALISLTSEVTTAYFNLIRSDKLLQLNTNLLCYLEKSLELRCSLFKEGEIPYDDVLLNEQAISQVKSNIAEIQKVQSLAVHQLCVLMGKSPVEQSCFPRTDFDCITFNNEIKLGSPCDLVSRRPDILAAEARLEAARINVSVARKFFFPTIRITGIFGFASSQLNNLFDWKSNLVAIGANAAQALFTGGKEFANLRAYKARHKAALAQYQRTVLTAFQEVEDSIKRLNSDFLQYNESTKQVSASECLLTLTNSRYSEGESSALDVINSQQQLISNQQALVQSKSTLLIDNIGLYRALGGGF